MNSNFWRTLFDPRGRRSRGGFWAYIGVSLLGYMVCVMLAGMLAMIQPNLFWVVFAPTLLAISVGSVINAIRRLHDLGHSGWWLALIILVAAVLALGSLGESESGGSAFAGLQVLLGLAELIWFGAVAGQPGPNRFGDSPIGSAEPVAA